MRSGKNTKLNSGTIVAIIATIQRGVGFVSMVANGDSRTSGALSSMCSRTTCEETLLLKMEVSKMLYILANRKIHLP
jgi:hypothetical protein